MTPDYVIHITIVSFLLCFRGRSLFIFSASHQIKSTSTVLTRFEDDEHALLSMHKSIARKFQEYRIQPIRFFFLIHIVNACAL